MGTRGRRYETGAKLNIKKVIAVILAIAVLIMFIIAIKTLLTTNSDEKTTSVNSYFPLYTSGKWGVINSFGDIVIQPEMDEIVTIPDRKTDLFIFVYDVDYSLKTYKTKVLNSKNEEKFTNYDLVEALENQDKNHNIWYETGVLRVKKADKYGLINYSGEEILQAEYDKIEALQGVENSIIVEKDGKVGLSDNKGKLIIPVEYKEIKRIEDDYKNGYVVVDENNKYGLVDFTGATILENKYNDIKQVASSSTYFVKEDSKWKAVNKSGNTLLENKFDDVKQINGNEIVFIKNNKYGVINTNGEEKIPAEYDDITYACNNYYIVKKDSKYGIVNNVNEVKLPTEYTSISYRKTANFFELQKNDETNYQILNEELQKKCEGIISEVNEQKGYIRVRQGEDYKYYNLKFEEKTSAEVLSNNLLLDKKDGKYGFIDKDGNVIVDYIYEDALEQNSFGFAAVKKDGKWGAIDKTGNVVAENQYELENNIIIDFIGKWHIGQDLNLNYYTDEN